MDKLRRRFIENTAALSAVFGLSGCTNFETLGRTRSPSIAITIDDFAQNDNALLKYEEADDIILQSFAQAGIKAAGFPAGKHIKNERGFASIEKWSRAGHLIGNHTFSHKYYNGGNSEATMEDILRCEEILNQYTGFQKLFRYPYLAEGNSLEGRAALKRLLSENGYSTAHVTIDTSDWYIDARLKEKLKQNPSLDLEPYRKYYLSHIWARAQYYDNLAKAVFGHSIDHTILLHHNLVNALFLGDLLKMFEENGWALKNPEVPFSSKEFQSDFAVIPSGQSLVWAGAKAKNLSRDLRFPAEDGKYEKPFMDELGL